MKTKYILILIGFIILINFQKIKTQIENSLFSNTFELKNTNEVNNWLSKKDYFEWTTMKFEQKSPYDIKLSISFDDSKGKFAGDKFNHWNVKILFSEFPIVFQKSTKWDVQQKKEISSLEILDLKQQITDLNKLTAISIKPTEDSQILYFDDWFGTSSCYIKSNKIQILLDECIVQILKPKLSNTKISFTYLKKDFPNSEFWINGLKKEGINCSYIEYFSNPVNISEVPNFDYSGWSIRPILPKSKFPLGINIACITKKNNEITINFDLQEEKLTYLFDKIKVVASKIPLVKVQCGNVKFTKLEWKKYLTEQISKKRT